jgi:microcompartment protein CcmK/EutM
MISVAMNRRSQDSNEKISRVNVVATRKHPSLEGWRLLICQPIGREGRPR